MPRLVAFDLAAGPSFVDALHRTLERGDALAPIDQRLPPRAKARLIEMLRPAAVLRDSGEETCADGRPTEDGDAVVVPTSGTTGEAKAVVLTRAAIEASARATSARLAVDPARDRWCCCLPVAHIGGLSVILRALFTETPLEVLATFDEQQLIDGVRAWGVTLTSLVPTMHGRLGKRAAAFRSILLGGAPPPAVLPGNVVTTYGMTETGSGVAYDGEPLDGVEVMITSDGEIALRGPMLLRAYRDGRDPKSVDGWLRTGDGGALIEGRLVVHGRIDELIITGGENVWPVAVESILARHHGVDAVAVAGLPDKEWGNRVVAYVIAASADDPPRLDELRELVRDELGPWAAPRQLILTEQLPRTPNGKVRRASLASLVTGHARSETTG